MKKSSSISQSTILKTLRYGFLALASICAILFSILWKNSHQQLNREQDKLADLKKNHQEIQEKLNKNTQLYNQNFKQKTSELNQNLNLKEAEISKLKKEIAEIQIQESTDKQRLLDPLIASLDIAQDIYAMKWESNSHVLRDMENHSTRTLEICRKWEMLCGKLSPNPQLAPQIAKIRIRLAQAYSSMGHEEKIDLSNIDWKAAQLENKKPEIQAHIWFSIASQFTMNGELAKAQKYLQKAKSQIPQIKASAEKATYFAAMMNLLEADILATTDPKKSLEFYIKAADDLSNLVAALPNNTKLRTTFIQACLDGAMLSEGGNSIGQAEKLRNRAFKNINTLLTDNPNMEKPHLLFAEVKILESEEMLRKGEQYKASELLKVSRLHIKEGGGSVLLTAEADGSQAFIHWDHGERTKAMAIINEAIANVTQFKQAEPINTEADYRLASLYWIRSSMHIAPADSIADGQKAVQYLVDLVQQGAGKREASARRMIAIIYGDIGHQAYTSEQKSIAKKYFDQAKSQWTYLIKNWGPCDEYIEGERWCTWRMKSL